MSECPNLHVCPFFNDRMKNMPIMAEVYKSTFCRKNYTICARFRVARATGKESVPADLFPNQEDRINKLING